MSENTEAPAANVFDPKKFGEEFSNSLAAIASGVNTMREEIKEIKTKDKEKERTHDDTHEDLFADEATRIEKIVEKKLESRISKIEERNSAKQSYLEECSKWDAKAYEEIPQMKNPKFYQEVQKELSKIPPIGKDPDTGKVLYPADAVYNAAWRARGKNPSLLRAVELENLDHGDFEKPTKSVEMTENQQTIANLMGIKADRAATIYKDWNMQKAQRRAHRL